MSKSRDRYRAAAIRITVKVKWNALSRKKTEWYILDHYESNYRIWTKTSITTKMSENVLKSK